MYSKRKYVSKIVPGGRPGVSQGNFQQPRISDSPAGSCVLFVIILLLKYKTAEAGEIFELRYLSEGLKYKGSYSFYFWLFLFYK